MYQNWHKSFSHTVYIYEREIGGGVSECVYVGGEGGGEKEREKEEQGENGKVEGIESEDIISMTSMVP